MGGGKTTKSQVIEALGYTPAGGENLALDSGIEESNTLYPSKTYALSKMLKEGVHYTVTIWANPDEEDRNSVEVYLGEDGLYAIRPNPTRYPDGSYRIIGGMLERGGENALNKKLQVQIYATPKGDTFTIHRFKLEPGIITDPVWTPAPEDVVVRSELDALIKRVAVLEAQASITSADSFMELPSIDETADDMEIN